MTIMNPMILELISSLANLKTDHPARALKSPRDGTNAFSGILKALSSVQEKSSPGTEALSGDGPLPGKNNYRLYLESFQKALRARGKPLNKVSLKREDLPLFKKFLCKGGYPREKMDRLFADLSQHNREGEINVSRLFEKITELGSPKNKKQPASFLDASAVPHLEFMLRNFGLSPGELEPAFSAARAADGRLDLEKFVVKLKGITNRLNSKAPLTALQKLDQQHADKLKLLGIHLSNQGRSDMISLQDFILSLEKAAGMPDGKHKLPAEVKTTMEQLLAKLVVADEKPETPRSRALGGKPVGKEGLLSPLLDKVKPDSESVLLAPFKEQNMHVAQNDLWPSLKAKNKPVARDGPLSSIKGTGKTKENEKQRAFMNERSGRSINSEQRSTASANRAEKAETLAKIGGDRGFEHEVKQQIQASKSGTKVAHMQQQMTGSTFSDAVHSVEQRQRSAPDLLPTYLVDQVGRQISRALFKADGVIRLQLKPPELGAVKIKMDMKDNVLRLEMITERSSVKEILLSHVHELRDALMEQGIKIEGLDVQVRHGFNHSSANSQEDLKQRQRLVLGEHVGPLTANNQPDDPESVLRNWASGDRLLNLVA